MNFSIGFNSLGAWPRALRAVALARCGAALAGATCVLVASCGERVEGRNAPASASQHAAHESRVLDLGKRVPDEVLDQPGLLVPDSKTQWGKAGVAGWSGYTTHDAAGRPGVWARRREAVLELPVSLLRDRTIELIAWVAAPMNDAEPVQRVEVELNGKSLGTVAVDTHPSEQRIEAPQAFWRQGANELLLRVPEMREGWSKEPLGIGLAQLSYGHARKVRVRDDDKGLVLDPHTRVRYRLEGVQDQRLELSGTSKAHDGGLVVTLRQFDSLTLQSTPYGEPEHLPMTSGRVSATLELPSSKSKILEVELEWLAEDDDDCEFELDTLVARAREPRTEPPVILISLDTVGARHLSVYGYPRRTTPRLEDLARESVVFERCLANSTWTLPSHMALMTGLYPAVHALEPIWDERQLPDLWEMWQLDERRWTLAEVLRAAGYTTAGFVDCLWLSDRFHFAQGFETFDLSAAEIPLDQSAGGIEHVSALAHDWLARRDERPPFLFVHAFDAHGPYMPPSPWKGQLAGRTLQQPVSSAYANAIGRCFGGIHDYISERYATDGVIPTRLPTDPIADAYDEGVLALDARLGDFFDQLRATDLWDEALVIVTADHGESMTSHDFYFAHGMAYEDVLHVPLIVKLPHGERGGTRVKEGVQLVDIYPTVVDYAGLDPSERGRHGRTLRPALEGRSLPPVPLLAQGGMLRQTVIEYDRWKLWSYNPTGDADLAVMLTYPGLSKDWLKENAPELLSSALTQTIYDQMLADPARTDRLWVGVHEQIDREYEELYDMRLDIDERTNLASSKPEIVDGLKCGLARELQRVFLTKSRLSTPIRGGAMTDADRATLRAIGYAGRK